MDFHKILSKLSVLEGAPSTKTLRESVEIRADGPEAMALLGHPEAGGSSSLPPPGDDFGFGNDGIGSNDLDDMADAALGGGDDIATDVAIDTVGDEGGDTSIGDLQRLSGLEPSVEEESDPLYANSPEEDIKPLAAAIPSGNDMHKEKGAYRSTALGDNPRAVTALENKLLQQWRSYLNESDKPKGESQLSELKGINNPKANQKYRAKASKSVEKKMNQADAIRGIRPNSNSKSEEYSNLANKIDSDADRRHNYITKAWNKS